MLGGEAETRGVMADGGEAAVPGQGSKELMLAESGKTRE